MNSLLFRKLILEPLILFAALVALRARYLKLRFQYQLLRCQIFYLRFHVRRVLLDKKHTLAQNRRYRKFHEERFRSLNQVHTPTLPGPA